MNHVNNAPRNDRTRRIKTKALPRSRSRLSQLLIGLVALILIAVSVATGETCNETQDIIITLISPLLPLPLLFLKELSLRILYMVEEYSHLHTRYENSVKTLCKDIFNFHFSAWIGAISSIVVAILSMKHVEYPYKLWYNMGAVSMLLSLLGCLFLERFINLVNKLIVMQPTIHVKGMCIQCGPLYDSLWIENSPGLDYGSGMAHSFFHGYLKLVIPKTGTQEKNLEELMKDYEDKHQIRLACYKLFILIPKSLHCFRSLMDTEFSPSIEESQSLESKEITVAGVRNRVYKNSVYKIKDQGGKVYVAAEYATPLKTFKDVVKHNGAHSNYYMKHKNDIVLQFYLTLKQILKDDADCTNYCELIFYDDMDENGRFKDVGKVLLQKIRKLRQRTQERQD